MNMWVVVFYYPIVFVTCIQARKTKWFHVELSTFSNSKSPINLDLISPCWQVSIYEMVKPICIFHTQGAIISSHINCISHIIFNAIFISVSLFLIWNKLFVLQYERSLTYKVYKYLPWASKIPARILQRLTSSLRND